MIVRALPRSLHILQELLILRFGLRGVQLPAVDQDTEAEGLGLAGFEREVERLLGRVTLGEFLGAERIGGEEAVTAAMPVGRVGDVLRVVEDADADVFAADVAGEGHPLGARAPGVLLADGAFAAQVDAVDAGVVELGDGGGLAAAVGEDLGLGRGLLERAGDADGDDAFLGIMEDRRLVLRGQGDDAVDDAQVLGGAEDEGLVLLEHLGAVGHDPIRGDFEGRGAVAAVDRLLAPLERRTRREQRGLGRQHGRGRQRLRGPPRRADGQHAARHRHHRRHHPHRRRHHLLRHHFPMQAWAVSWGQTAGALSFFSSKMTFSFPSRSVRFWSKPTALTPSQLVD